MAGKTNYTKGNKNYYRMTKVVGHKINEAGKEIPVRKEFYGTCKKDAEDKYLEYLDNKAKGIDNKKRYFGVEADKWLNTVLANEDGLSINTIRLYIKTWQRYIRPLELYHMPLNDVSAMDIKNAYNMLKKNGCPVSAIQTINKVMKRFYDHLVVQKYVPNNFIYSLSIPKVKKEEEHEVVIWTDEEIHTILNSFDKAQNGFRLRFLLVLAKHTGMRISELLGLKYSDIVETDSGYIVKVQRQVTELTSFKKDHTEYDGLGIKSLKSESSYRSIPVSDTVIRELEIHRAWHRQEAMKNGYIASFSYIFTTNTGKLYDKHNLDAACKRYYERIGVPYKSFHTYRHTFGTNLYKKGVPMKTASKLLGHKDERITSIYYVEVEQDDMRRAIELLEDAS